MPAQRAVVSFVHDALSAGHSRDQIAGALAEAGWSRRDIEAGLAAYAETGFVPPVPRPTHTTTPRHTFLHAILFIAMAITAINLVNLLHAQIDLAVADPAFDESRDWLAPRIRWSVAALVVATPVYVLVSRHIMRSAATDDAILKSPVRKWLTYLALLVSALVFLGDAIYTVDRFLAGELSLRFALKAGTVALVSGAVFVHYLKDVERTQPGGGAHLAITGGAVALAVAGAFLAIGGPQSARSDRFDRARYEDLDAIASALECAFAGEIGERALPGRLTLPAIAGHCIGARLGEATLSDDETGAPYLYRRTGETEFLVCAEFRDAEELAASLPAIHPGFDPATGCIAGRVAPAP
ncbi:DUF5671 domain-containing protein [Roseibacterium sp. SDUM158017]|uniref:DUF5671 domain-containing protein n=1 Tax=Roseicyclus salinarum TaxID=3036773 RepID=UPI00241513D3|nr:DUF5671 domain-containing protein [Roseibacterium sp. SDUM158017]MDG4649333.1 DUF5671 domain-containing protein [Roseibacterium sp. SDUM158017]